MSEVIWLVNPKTGKLIKKGAKTHRKLLIEGLRDFKLAEMRNKQELTADIKDLSQEEKEKLLPCLKNSRKSHLEIKEYVIKNMASLISENIDLFNEEMDASEIENKLIDLAYEKMRLQNKLSSSLYKFVEEEETDE